MSLKKYRTLWFLAAFLSILAASGIALFTYIKTSFTKPRIEAALSESLGMQVLVAGRSETALFPPSSLSLYDVRLLKNGEIARAEKVIINMPLRSFVGGEIRVTGVRLVSPVFNLRREKTGRFNFWKKGTGFPFGDIESFSVSNGSLSYADDMDGHEVDIKKFDLDLEVDDVKTRDGNKGSGKMSATGGFAAKNILFRGLEFGDVKCKITAAKGLLELKPFNYKLFDGLGSGSVRVNMYARDAVFYVTTELSGFRPEKIPAAGEKIKGAIDATAKFSVQTGQPELAGTISGDVSIRGKDLTLIGTDLDRSLSTYEKSQHFNLFDIGAFVFLGPIGSGLTTGYKMASAAAVPRGGSTEVKKLVSVWKISKGTAEARDVALSTKENRVALKGRLNLARSNYEDVTIAAVDEEGCAKISEKIEGPFNKPRVSRTGPLKSVVAPVVNVFRKTKRLITGKCEVFYTGSVSHPK